VSSTPFNLSDVVPFRKEATTPGDSKLVGVATRWQEGFDAVTHLRKMLNVIGDVNRDEQVAFRSLSERWEEKAAQEALGVLAETGYLPTHLRKNPVVARLSNLPTVDMAELRAVIDVLDMTIMPWEYLNPSAYEKETWEMRGAIAQFAKDAGKPFHVYVAAPVQYYDVRRHVAAAEDKPIFAGLHVAPAFLAMGMALPLFRSMKADIAAVMDQTNRHTQRIAQAEQQIQQISVRVAQLQTQVERQQAEQIRLNLQQARMEAELTAAKARASFMAYEPMLVALPKNRTVLDDGHAIVGPCWGPDFDAVVMTALNLRKHAHQRATLTQAVRSFMPGESYRRD
jgi:hypothetical protein